MTNSLDTYINQICPDVEMELLFKSLLKYVTTYYTRNSWKVYSVRPEFKKNPIVEVLKNTRTKEIPEFDKVWKPVNISNKTDMILDLVTGDDKHLDNYFYGDNFNDA